MYLRKPMSFLLIIFPCFLISCGSHSLVDKSLTKIDVYENEIDTLSSSKVILDFQFTFLESKEDALIGNITKLIKTSEYLFILDAKISKKIFVFHNSGEFVRCIGKRGRGPEEYVRIVDFCVCDETKKLYILDDERAIIVTDFNGNHITEVKVPEETPSVTHLAIWNEELFCYTGLRPTSQEKYQIVKFNQDLSSYEFFLPYKSDFPIVLRYKNVFYENSGVLHFVSFYDNAIYAFNRGKFQMKFLFDFKNRTLDLNNITPNEFISNTESGFIYSPVLEGEDILFISIFDRGRPKYGFFSKSQNKFYLVNSIVDQDSSPFFLPDSYAGNRYISSCSSTQFIEYFPDSSTLIKESDNPIILTYNLTYRDEK